MKQILSIVILAFCFATSAWAQVTGPETVKVGQPIKFNVTDPTPGDLISWQVLTPRGDSTTVIQTEYGIDFIVDTGCQFQGKVEVLCTVVNFDTQKFVQEVLDCQVGTNQPTPPEPTPPEPTPPNPDWESDVPNDPFDNVGKRIDTFIHENYQEISRRAELASEFELLASKMENYEIRTPDAAREYLNDMIRKYRPEWNGVFDFIKEDGSQRTGMVWSQVIEYYNSIGAGIRG